MFCLPFEQATKFLDKLRSGDIDPVKLADMTSAERRTFFTDIIGETNAKQVNALFESKLLLKNQQQGFVTWARNVSGLSEPVRRDILNRVERMTEVLQPAEMDSFLTDLAEKKLGMGVTFEEAGKITELAHATTEAKSKMNKDFTFPSEDARLDYGRKLVDFNDYVNDLKTESKKQTLADFKASPGRFIANKVSDIGGLAKSLKATLDNSVLGRQGLKTMFTNPQIWAKNALQSFVDIVKTFGGSEVIRDVKADVMSRPNALNGLYAKEKLAVGNLEEAYPTRFPEKIPGVGRIFKASEAAFTAFQYRTRADVFDKYVELAEKTGADIQGIGKVANALTGRGNLGSLEPSANFVNNLFFSPRFLKSNIDLLTVHALDKGIGSFARKQAAMNLVKVVAGIAGVLTIANAVNPGSVEEDPRSADFGKIRIGDTRFDMTGGISSLATLASRVAPIFAGKTPKTKSSVTGVVSDLNSGKYGSQNVSDVLIDFFSNKAAPLPAVFIDLFKGKDRDGNKPSVLGELKNTFEPLPITTGKELLKNPNGAPFLLGMISDGLGFGTNTYSQNTNWSQNPGVELKAFKDSVGEKKFQEANDAFNTKYNEWLKSVGKVDKFNALSADEQKQVLTNKKDSIRTEIFKDYGFKYHKAKPQKTPKF